MNLAVPTDRVVGAKQVYCATPADNNHLKETGGKGDEADAAKLQVTYWFTIILFAVFFNDMVGLIDMVQVCICMNILLPEF